MKDTDLFSRTHGLSSRYILLLILIPWFTMSFNHVMIAQFTQWQQDAASDYYLNLNWSSTYNGPACDCWVNPDLFSVYLDGSPDFLLGQVSYAHATVQTHSTSHPLGPNRLHNVFGTINVSGNVDIPPFGCTFPQCVGGPTSASTAMQTATPYPPTPTTPTWNADGSTTLHWTNNSDIPAADRSTLIYRGIFYIGQTFGDETSFHVPCAQPNDVFSFYTWFNGSVAGQTYDIIGPNSSYTIPNPRPLPTPPPMGKIQGQITTLLGGSPVSGVTVTAVLMNPGAITNGFCWPSTYTDVTDAAGEYVIPFIYWGQGSDMANYQITPSLPMHGFDPAQITRTLQAGDFIKTQNFHDTTSFVISGTVFDLNTCGLDSALLTATPGAVVPVYTLADGTYDLVVPQTGTYQVTATYNGMSIGMQSIMVNANTGGHNFNYTAKDTLRGFVGAGCNEYIGQATLTVQTEAGCLLQTVMTNASGYYQVVLPSRQVEVQVTAYNPGNSGLDMLTVLNAIDDVHEINLDSTTVLDIFYRKPISIEIIGLPGPPCPAIENPVLNQAVPYGLTLLVWEEPGLCFADTGYIAIQNNIGTSALQSTILDTIPVSNGVAIYYLIPGEPALAAPYLKNITFTAHVDAQSTSVTKNAIVSGSRQRTATFTTGAPTSLPYLILRDPPGDLSKSFFSQDTTRSYAQAFSTLASGGVKIWARGKLGAEGLGLKAWGQIEGAISVGGSSLSTEETLVEMTSSFQVETSSDEDVVGPGGDLIIGAAVNFIYGLADERKFDLNTCTIIPDTVLIFSPDTFATTFRLTVDDIRNITIPKLQILANNLDSTEEARARFRNEILLWEQTLQLNEDLKAEALADPVGNHTLSASAGPETFSTTGIATTTKMLEFQQYIQGDIAAEAGLEIFGSGGAFGVAVTIRGEFTQSSVESTTIATTTGFTFDDNDNGIDLVSFDYAVDKVYGTPVFGNLMGQTSCPHEPGTQFVDVPTMTTPNPVKFVPSGNSVEFILTLGNSSESDNTRTYVLDFIEQSNEFGALVYSGANPFSGTIPFTIAGSTTNTTVRIERHPSSSYYSFEGLQFDFYPACDTSSKKTIYLSAYFANTCSNITLASPGSNWLVNDMMNDEIDITMTGYTLGPDVDTVKLLYSPAGSQAWKSSNIVIPGPNLLAPPQTYSWDVSNIPDGLYNIRLALVCNETINFSTRVQGRIDRKPPAVFGIEEPKDDLYHPGDSIFISFKEDINCSLITSATCYLMSLPQNEMYPAQFICNGKDVKVVPDADLSGLYNHAFEVGLIHVEDLYSNHRPDTVKWQFVISEPDADQDGVPDTKDRCPGGNDYLDTDLDGLPDDCDCMPTVAENGRLLTKAAMDFDGVNDQIVIPHNADFDPGANISFTFEAWVKAESGILAQTILSKGAGSGGTTSYIFSLYQNKIALYIGGGGATATWLYGNTDVTFNTWMHAAVSYDHTTQVFTFYMNGEYDGQGMLPHGFYANSSPLYIGRQGETCNCNFYKGRIDEVRFWNAARTPAEILENMHHELQGDEPGLAAYYDFNEGTPFGNNTDLTIIEDKSENNHSGSLSGFAKTGIASNWVNSTTEHLDIAYDLCTSCPDTINVAMDFDGVNDKISIPNHPAMVPTTSSSMTIETWIYPRDVTPGSADILVAAANNLYFARLVSGHVQVFTGSFVATPAILPSLTWSHVAAVFEPTSVKIYINGSLEFESAITHNSVNAGNPISIGATLLNNDYALNGKMDDLRFWNYARSEAQILTDMMQEVKGDESGLVAYYNFNQGVPGGNNTGLTTIEDVTGNGHTGTLSEFARTGIKSNWVTSPFNFPDSDKDGLPDPCDDCFALKDLTLQNMVLDGTFKARETITLGSGNTFASNADVFLRAPEVRVLQFVHPLSGITIVVAPDPCGN